MALGMEVGLGPDHIVLDGDLAPLPKKGTEPPGIFGPFLLWPNGWMHQGATWYGGRPRPRPHCSRWGPTSPLQKRGHTPPVFGPCLLWQNGWIDQNTTWYGGGLSLGDNLSSPKGAQSPSFWSVSIVAKGLDGLRCHLVWS